MITLAKWTLLRWAWRRHPEMFDPAAALDAIEDALAEIPSAGKVR